MYKLRNYSEYSGDEIGSYVFGSLLAIYATIAFYFFVPGCHPTHKDEGDIRRRSIPVRERSELVPVEDKQLKLEQRTVPKEKQKKAPPSKPIPNNYFKESIKEALAISGIESRL